MSLAPAIPNRKRQVNLPQFTPGGDLFDLVKAVGNLSDIVGSSALYMPPSQNIQTWWNQIPRGTAGVTLVAQRGAHNMPWRGLAMDKPNVTLQGAGQFATVMIRENVPGVTYQPMLTLSQDNITIRDITFLDPYALAGGVATLYVTGNTCIIRDCTFVNSTILVDGPINVTIQNCKFAENGASTSVRITGISKRHVIAFNSGTGYTGEFIYADDNVTISTFVGNVGSSAAANVVNYKAPGGSVATGNIGVVTARP